MMRQSFRWLNRQPGASRFLPAGFSPAKRALSFGVERVSQWIVAHIMMDAEPHVWYTCDPDGNLWWNADDPVRGRSLRHATEAEMRVWLEQRHIAAEA